MSETTEKTAQDPMLPQIVDGVVHVALVLAHPLKKKDLERCQAVERNKPGNVGDVIHVSREWGFSLIENGRVQVDPEDRTAVQAALYLNKRDQPLTTTEFGKAVEAYVEAATADQVTGETASQKKIRELEEKLAEAQAQIAGTSTPAEDAAGSEPASDAAEPTPGETGESDTGQKPTDTDPGTTVQARAEAPARGARAGKNS